MNDLVPRSQLTGQGVKGVFAIGGGVALLVLAGGGWFGIVAGGILAVAGLALMGSRGDRRAGAAALGVGAATLITGLLGGRFLGLGWLMRAAGLVSLGFGVYWIAKFIMNLRKRS